MTTPYRNDGHALRERKATLEAEIAALREEAKALESIEARQAALTKELADVDAKIGGEKHALPLLDNVRVASPCSASWDEMAGDEHVRFCGKCEKNVFNLSSMSREDAEALLRANAGGRICVRYYQRKDGTVLTSDCPVGVARKRKKRLALAAASAGAVALAAVTASSRTRCHTATLGGFDAPPRTEVRMGDWGPGPETPTVTGVAPIPSPTEVAGGLTVPPPDPTTRHAAKKPKK